MTPFLTAILAVALSIGVTKADVRKLLDAGVSDQTIIQYIRGNGPAEPLSVDDVTDLKKAGASDSVIRAMLDSSRATDAVTPSAPPADRSTTTYDSYSYPSYSYSYSSYAPYYYSYSYPYSYPYYYPYYYPSFYFSSYPRSYYPYRYPYYHNYSHPNSVAPYRQHQHQPQTVHPTQPHHGHMGPVRR